MAMMLRNENELATLRCSMGVQARQPVMRLRPFIGAEPLAEERNEPFSALDKGLMRMPLPRFDLMMQQIENDPENAIGQMIRHLDHEAPPGAPLWMQIGQDSPECALIPWERIIQKMTGRNALRVPNFLRNPFMPIRQPRLAICISTPESSEVIQHHLETQLTACQDALTGTEIELQVVLFAEESARNILLKLAIGFSTAPNLNVSVAPLPEPALLEDLSETKKAARMGSQVWLRWMAAHFDGEVVDGVHFICPAYDRRDRGALALSATPFTNTEDVANPSTSPDALIRFYDRLGCSIMGFSAIGAAPWKDAVRLLAYHLSWARPGMIYVHQASDEPPSYAGLLRAIWSHHGLEQSAGSTSPAYVHPAAIKGEGAGFADDPPAEQSDPDMGFVSVHPEKDDAVVFYEEPEISQVNSSENGSPDDYLMPYKRSPLGVSIKRRASRGLADFLDDLLPGGMGLPSAAPSPSGDLPDPFGPDPEDLPKPAYDAERIHQQLELQRARITTTKSRTPLEEAHDKGTRNALDFLGEVMKR